MKKTWIAAIAGMVLAGPAGAGLTSATGEVIAIMGGELFLG
jgi:ethanolamine utilization microcompartment shell protein EutL